MPSFSACHYRKVAASIEVHACQHERSSDAFGIAKALASDLADLFAEDNQRFERARFLEAAGVGPVYEIRRVFHDDSRESIVIERGVSLAYAQKYCKDPSTSNDEAMDTYEQEAD